MGYTCSIKELLLVVKEDTMHEDTKRHEAQSNHTIGYSTTQMLQVVEGF